MGRDETIGWSDERDGLLFSIVGLDCSRRLRRRWSCSSFYMGCRLDWIFSSKSWKRCDPIREPTLERRKLRSFGHQWILAWIHTDTT